MNHLYTNNELNERIGQLRATQNLETRSWIMGSIKLLLLIQWASLFLSIGLGATNGAPLVLITQTIGLSAFCVALLSYNRRTKLQLRQSCRHQAVLEQANRDSEEIIWNRTKELKTVSRQLRIEIDKRVRAESSLDKLTRKLLSASQGSAESEFGHGQDENGNNRPGEHTNGGSHRAASPAFLNRSAQITVPFVNV